MPGRQSALVSGTPDAHLAVVHLASYSLVVHLASYSLVAAAMLAAAGTLRLLVRSWLAAARAWV